MAYRVDLTARAVRDLEALYQHIQADNSEQAKLWFNELERAVRNLSGHPKRCPRILEDGRLRHLLYGAKLDVYRVIFTIDEEDRVVTVLHIRHSARRAPIL